VKVIVANGTPSTQKFYKKMPDLRNMVYFEMLPQN